VQLGRAGREGFVRVQFDRSLRQWTPPARRRGAEGIAQDGKTVEGQRLPSIETFLHALMPATQGVQFVGQHASLDRRRLAQRPAQPAIFSPAVCSDQIVGTRSGDGLCAIRRSRFAAGIGDRGRLSRSSPSVTSAAEGALDGESRH